MIGRRGSGEFDLFFLCLSPWLTLYGQGLSIVNACRKILKDMGPIGFYAGTCASPSFSIHHRSCNSHSFLPSFFTFPSRATAGVVPYVTMDGLSGAIKFATYEWGKKLVAPILPPALHAYSHFVCAAGAFLSCSVVMVPGELLKQRLQAGVVPNMVGGIKQIWKQEGLPGFFTGYKYVQENGMDGMHLARVEREIREADGDSLDVVCSEAALTRVSLFPSLPPPPPPPKTGRR